MIAPSSHPPAVLPVRPGQHGPLSSAALLRTTGIFAKDVIRHLGTFFALLLASLGAVYVPWLGQAALGRGALSWGEIQDAAPNIYFGMLTAAAYLFGLVISAEEIEGRTLSFLDSLPVSRVRLFLSKLAAGVVLLLLWALTAGCLMGFLSGRGGDLLRFLVQTPENVHAILNYGRSFPVTLLQCLSLLLTGLVAGSLFRHFAGGAALGMVTYLTYTIALSNLLDTPGKTWQKSNLITGSGLALWCLLMTALYPAVSRRLRTTPTHGSALSGFTLDWWTGLAEKLTFPSRRRSFDPPHRHLLRAPLLLLAVLSPLGTWLFPVSSGSTLVWIIICSCLVAFFGAATWLPEERQGGRFFVYALPVPRSRIFWPRVRSTLVSVLLLGVFNEIAYGLALYQHGGRSLILHLVRDLPSQVLVVAAVAVIAASVTVALLAQLFRLFFRGILIPAVLSLTVGWGWVFISWQALGNTVSPAVSGPSGLLSPAGSAVQLFWNFALPPALPILAGWLAYCRTRLLEKPERSRSSVGFVLFLVLLVWGGFLLGLSPAHLWILLVG